MKSAKEMREQALEISYGKEFELAKKNILRRFEKAIASSAKRGELSVELISEPGNMAFQAALEEVRKAGYEVIDTSEGYDAPIFKICWLMGGEDID